MIHNPFPSRQLSNGYVDIQQLLILLWTELVTPSANPRACSPISVVANQRFGLWSLNSQPRSSVGGPLVGINNRKTQRMRVIRSAIYDLLHTHPRHHDVIHYSYRCPMNSSLHSSTSWLGHTLWWALDGIVRRRSTILVDSWPPTTLNRDVRRMIT